MHRRIVEQIEQIIVNSPWCDKVDVYVQRTDKNGFWKIAIHARPGAESYLKHIEAFALPIGRAYGEGLAAEIDVFGGWLVLS